MIPARAGGSYVVSMTTNSTTHPTGPYEGETARRLTNARDEVARLWEANVRAQVAGTSDRSSAVLQNGVPEFLDELALLLASPLPREALEQRASTLAVNHGQERATI